MSRYGSLFNINPSGFPFPKRFSPNFSTSLFLATFCAAKLVAGNDLTLFVVVVDGARCERPFQSYVYTGGGRGGYTPLTKILLENFGPYVAKKKKRNPEFFLTPSLTDRTMHMYVFNTSIFSEKK